MRLFRNKKQEALSPLPGHFSEEDPEKVIFDASTKLRVEANHWKVASLILGVITAGAVWTRNPPPSIVESYGVSGDGKGHPLVTHLEHYQPNEQEIRTSLNDDVVSWFTIEPVLSKSLDQSRMVHSITAVKAKMIGTARNQFGTWLKTDAPFQAITADPRLVRETVVTDISLLEDSTAVVQFRTTSTDNPQATPVVQNYALTVRYQVVPPTSVDALGTNPFGVFYPFFTLQKTQ